MRGGIEIRTDEESLKFPLDKWTAVKTEVDTLAKTPTHCLVKITPKVEAPAAFIPLRIVRISASSSRVKRIIIVTCPFCRRYVRQDEHDFVQCRQNLVASRVACPRCSSLETRKVGFSYGIQCWHCLTCNRWWQECRKPDDARRFGNHHQNNVIEAHGTCFRCKKLKVELADGLCVDCYDNLGEDQLHRYRKKFRKALEELKTRRITSDD